MITLPVARKMKPTDKKKTYHLYEAPSPEPIREAARRLGIPADVIVEVNNIKPEMFL